MLLAFVPFLLQAPTQQRIVEVEHARPADIQVLTSAIAGNDTMLQRIAVRAVGRLERSALKDVVTPALRSAHASVRREAVNALAQMNAAFDYGSLLPSERDPGVRAVIFEAMGRVSPVAGESQRLLLAGLTEPDEMARTGAARGVEALFRLSARTMRPDADAIAALRTAARANNPSSVRELVLLTLNAARDRDPQTFAAAIHDPDPQVRRLAVIGSGEWADDPSPMVRYESMRLAGTCERAERATREEPSELVVLMAIDILGTKSCSPAVVEPLVTTGRTWRVRAHAIVSLARVSPASARALLPLFARDTVWQARMYAASAAKIAHDTLTLSLLAGDRAPNVAAQAMTTADDARRGLASSHAGLLFASAQHLKGVPELPATIPAILATLERLRRDGRATMRDARVQLLERVREAGDATQIATLRTHLSDVDPVVAKLAAEIMSQKSGAAVAAVTTTYAAPAVPGAAELAGLRGAHARVTMANGDVIVLALLTDEAPVTVATFARLAGEKRFDGLTFHRMVPNFVIQGGSPGADEYDGATREFMRDEIGLARNTRGSLGISTRGHDTGDGQIYVNLVDNFRLDHAYTIFAQVVDGMDALDRVLEGDVMRSVVIEKRQSGR